MSLDKASFGLSQDAEHQHGESWDQKGGCNFASGNLGWLEISSPRPQYLESRYINAPENSAVFFSGDEIILNIPDNTSSPFTYSVHVTSLEDASYLF